MAITVRKFNAQVKDPTSGDMIPAGLLANINAIYDWLDEHPEATVQDSSLTEAKFTDELKLKSIKDYVTPEMFGAVGDGITDDTASIRAALKYSIDNGIKLKIIKKYYIKSSLLTSSDYSSAKLNIEGAGPLKSDVYSILPGTTSGIRFDDGINLFEGITIYGSISRVTFTPVSRTQTGSVFKNCTLIGFVFSECTVSNILAFCHNTDVKAVSKFNENHFLSITYFAKSDSNGTSHGIVDSLLFHNYINGGGSPEGHCFEWNDFTDTTLLNNIIDYYQTMFYPVQYGTRAIFRGPNSIANSYQVFRYFYVKAPNVSIISLNSQSDRFDIMDADGLPDSDTYRATKEAMNNYVVYTYKQSRGNIEYEDNLKPYIMFVDGESQVTIKDAIISLYTKNLVYLAGSITDYEYSKAELTLNIVYSTTTYRDYENCVQHFSGQFFNGGAYKFNTIKIPFIKTCAELPTVSNFSYNDCYLGEKVRVGNKIYRLYTMEESWLHPAWYDISAFV